MELTTLLYIALLGPLVGSLFAALFGATPKKTFVGIIASALLFAAMLASLTLLTHVITTGEVVRATLFDWINSGNFHLAFSFAVDEITAVMISVVTIVSTMVHIYSIGYMEHDSGFNRFFSYLSAFVFSMMVLVMSDNFLGLFIGWEGVGVCSYLLVGFWYHKRTASWAANEAFIMNRVADLGMLLGIFLIYWNLGTIQYDEVFANVAKLSVETTWWISVLLFIGAMGKSAQFPLHTWLADAMEGPTPVSALIHAATMVTAGVYLVVRSHDLYALVPEIGVFIASLGAFVALFAASMALVNNDLKRVIAYSTLSQLGYMFVAAGLGAYWVALFHLMTHAFFKAALFLGAGNVMHAMHDELDLRKMGGLYKVMKPTAIFMAIASVALAGIPPLAGYFSKDKILEVAFGDAHFLIYGVLLFTALLTAFYSFRLWMMAFHGESRCAKGLHPHEAHKFMLAVIAPLILLAIVSGFMFEDTYKALVSAELPMYMPHMDHSLVLMLAGMTVVLVLMSIGFAVYKYSRGGFSESLQETFIYKLLSNQYYIPLAYEKFLTIPYTRLSELAWKIDQKVVDAIVDFVATTVYKSGEASRNMQTGNLSSMLRLMTFGFILVLGLGLIGTQFGVLGLIVAASAIFLFFVMWFVFYQIKKNLEKAGA
jgi:NADH-quinone oxidoreductase subunit L